MPRPIARLALFLILLVSSALFAADPGLLKDEPTKPLPRAELEEGIFVQSGDVKVSAKDVERVMTLFLTAEKKQHPNNVPSADTLLRARVQIAEQLLQNRLVVKYVKDKNLPSDGRELTTYIDTIRAQQMSRGTTFEQMLIDTGQTEEEFRALALAKIALQSWAAAKITDADVQKYYDANAANVPLRSAAHILIQYKGADGAERTVARTKEEARALAEDILKQLKAGKDFAELAKSSDDASGKTKGGEVGFFPLNSKAEGSMVPAFAQAAYALKNIGDISPIVETLYGLHIIKLTGNRESDYRPRIKGFLISEEVDKTIRPIFDAAIKNEKFSDKLSKLDVQTAIDAGEKIVSHEIEDFAEGVAVHRVGNPRNVAPLRQTQRRQPRPGLPRFPGARPHQGGRESRDRQR